MRHFSINFFKITSYFSFLGLAFTLSCNHQSEGEVLAKTHCGSCHVFPEPSLLDKATWSNNILPVMAKQLGLQIVDGEAYLDIQRKENGQFESVSSIMPEDWKKIVAYYEKKAPEKLPNQDREPVSAISDLFSVKSVSIPQSSFPSVTYIKIDTANQQIYAASDALLSVFDKTSTLISAQKINQTIVDIDFGRSLAKTGNRHGYFTNIGILNPNDLTKGTLHSFDFSSKRSFKPTGTILENLPRPVQSISVDLDKDGLTDQLVCGYGNEKGALFWNKNLGNKSYQKKLIREAPGAIKAYIDDANKDGLPDIWVLFAQGQEGVFLFTNTGKDAEGEIAFETKEILRFPPVYGSCFFELVDLNNDGYQDILYTSGDNADYSTHLLKNFHGVYGYLNDGITNGSVKFTQAFFYPIHGCFKALAKDFDQDGDLDIATISYFPDNKNQPNEGFVYLENQGKFSFKASSIKEVKAGNWLVMDAADLDGDGDDDIVLGNFDRKKRGQTNESKRDTAMLVLMNRVR